MKRKDFQELTSKEMKELKTLLIAKQEELFTSHLDHQLKKLTNVRLLSTIRDDIARIKTVMKQKEVKSGKTV